MPDPLLAKLDELIAVTRASSTTDLYLDVAGVAAILGHSERYARDSITKLATFPAPFRLGDNGHPRWLRSDVLKWAKAYHRR